MSKIARLISRFRSTMNLTSRKTLAILVAIALPLVILIFVIVVSDRPFLRGINQEGKALRAAVAIRDNVIPFEKWGTRIFTWPYIEKCYNKIAYFTQASKYDKKDEFKSLLKTLLGNHEYVDLFLLAHTNNYCEWVQEIDSTLRAKIRLVYNSGCRDSDQAETWLKLGATTYVGHPGISSSEVFYFYFLRRWTRGYSARDALVESNELMRRYFYRTAFLHGLSDSEVEELYRQSKAELSSVGDLTIDSQHVDE